VHGLNLRVLIVDDEAPARARLRRLLGAHDGVEVVGEAGDGAQALAQVGALAPDVVLLDVQMPETSGLDVAASLPEPAPAIVFVTAHDRYALPAFDAAAVDYLLKPVEPARLATAIGRVRARVASRTAPAPMPGLAPRRLLIPDRGRTHVVACDTIEWLEAADNYVVVHAQGRAPLLRRTLEALLVDLGEGFVRVHRSAAVALAHVTAVEVGDKGDAIVHLRGGAQVPCSRRWRGVLAQRLGR
jgi:two-component system LytT family response regulator